MTPAYQSPNFIPLLRQEGYLIPNVQTQVYMFVFFFFRVVHRLFQNFWRGFRTAQNPFRFLAEKIVQYLLQYVYVQWRSTPGGDNSNISSLYTQDFAGAMKHPFGDPEIPVTKDNENLNRAHLFLMLVYYLLCGPCLLI